MIRKENKIIRVVAKASSGCLKKLKSRSSYELQRAIISEKIVQEVGID